MKYVLKAVLVVIILNLMGCASEQKYMVSIVNSSKSTIDDAHVLYDGFESVGGVISPGGISRHLYPEVQIPVKAIVQWRTHDDKLHEKEVEVRKLVPEKIKVEIIFEITAENEVVVRSKPWQ
jgi:hypothetical protein